MMGKKLSLIIIILFLLISTNISAQKKSAGLKRFIVSIGANYGGQGRVRLKYAISDASAFIDVFKEIGGVDTENCYPLYNPDPRIFFSTMNQVKKKLSSSKKEYRKTELIFYYSGHSDESGILLGNDKILYKDIKKILDSIPADVKITILDSCSSGAFTRQKGGKMKPSFLFDTSYDMKGNAIMTSSSSDEVSQESDSIQGSFFTHYLLIGLKGAADVTQDSRITLNEAYQYAFNNTLQRTEKTMGGAQHPNYHIKMVGTGDVILTDIRKSSSKIILDKKLYGTIYIRDDENFIIAELNKPLGSQMTVAIRPGKYSIINFRDRNNYKTSIIVTNNSSYYLKSSKFSKSGRETTYYRGEIPIKDEPTPENQKEAEVSKTLLDRRTLTFSGYGAITNSYTYSAKNFTVYTGFKGALLINNTYAIGAFGLGLANNRSRSNFNSNKEYIDEYPDFSIGFGGIYLERYFRTNEVINFSVGLGLGAGAITLSSSSDDNNAQSDSEDYKDIFFAAYPEAAVYVKITRWCRVGLTGSYIFTRKINSYGFTDSDFNSFTAGLVAQFGWF